MTNRSCADGDAAWQLTARFLLGTFAFGLAYGQAPLYHSNQNQYFLHGLAAAGFGFLQDDWLANTTDPTPIFSFLVRITYRHLHEYVFYGYYLLLFGIYSASMVSLFALLAGKRNSAQLRLSFFALFLLIHSALLRWGSDHLFGRAYPWYLQAGVAGQYALGPMFQPSTFGVLLILSISLFVRRNPFWAVASAVLAATVHSTYLLGAGMLTLAFMIVLWREHHHWQALRLGTWALLLVLPVLIYVVITFRPTSTEALVEAQQILVQVRIPHHAIPRLWCDGIALGQVAWMLLALHLVRQTLLLPVLAVTFLLSLGLTLLQVATGNDTLALLFPWRFSAVLAPIATTVILSRLVIAGARWFERPVVRVVNVLLVAGLVIAGLVLTWQDFQTNDDELPLLEYVKAKKTKGDVYLLPVEAPDLAAAPGTIPAELQRFRLYTGAAIFVDFKSIPYKDTDVLEWHRRIRLNQTLLAQMRAAKEEDVRAELKRSGITHVVTKAGQELKGSEFVQVHEDPVYRLYRATSPKSAGFRNTQGKDIQATRFFSSDWSVSESGAPASGTTIPAGQQCKEAK
ncbi:MAG: hypothetical protein L0387_27770 [Acidobacteria bacterium]|nr:hypothetical protein [Acidobacteriota bacterium]